MFPFREQCLDPAIRLRLFWRLQAFGWITSALIGVPFAATFFGVGFILVILARTLFGFLVTCGLRYLYRLIRARTENIWITGAGVLLLCGTLGALDGAVAQYFYQPKADLPFADQLEQLFFLSFVVRSIIYWVWSLLYFGINFWLDAQAERLHRARVEAEAEASELRFLQAQTHPHFLFNALNTILSEIDNPKARSLIQALSEYLRFSIRKHRESEPLGLELDALENYLEVEQVRFQKRFTYGVDVTSEARCICVPNACVQPLLENAIKYGRQTCPEFLAVRVSARVTGEILLIAVHNTGRWVIPESGRSTKTGIDNLRRRLSLIYGESASLTLSHDDEGVLAEIQLPVSS